MKSNEPLSENKLRDVVASMRPEWGPSHYDSVRYRVGAEVRRRRRRVGIFAGVAGVALLVVLSMSTGRLSMTSRIETPKVAAVVPAFNERSKSRVNPAPNPPRNDDPRIEIVSLAPRTTVRPEPAQDRLAFNLVQGAARFKVNSGSGAAAPRPVEVHVRNLRIQDIGTIFDVRLSADESVTVSVQEGLVLVTGPGISRYVKAGKSAVFYEKKQPALKMNLAPVGLASATSIDDQSPTAPLPPVEQASKDPTVEPPEVQALLAAADLARKEGRLDEALNSIRSFIARCSHTTSCSFGKFTEGKVLQAMGRNVDAATSFQAAAQGPLAEEALVRAIESLERAGASTQAGLLKARYRSAYPDGTFRGRLQLE